MEASQISIIGQTPVIQVTKFSADTNLYVKLESKNPLGSVKDRVAWGMIRRAEREGLLKPGDTVVEPTSGNTGIGLAWICRIRGYKLILTMPDTMSVERRSILKFLGAEVVLTEGNKGMQGAIHKALEISEEKYAYYPDQFSNPGNPHIHFETTGPEIWKSLNRKVDYAVFGVGTGGTLTGAGKFLQSENPHIKIVAVEPAASPVIAGGNPCQHKIEGIGAGFIPHNLDVSLIDEIIHVTECEAVSTSKALADQEGIFVGISSGAAAFAAKKIAQNKPDKRIIAILPDTAERYLSTDLFLNI